MGVNVGGSLVGAFVGGTAVGMSVGGSLVGAAAALVGAAAESACPQAANAKAKHPIKNTILRM